MDWNVVIASATVIFSAIAYVLTRRRELAWKRTEFMATQAHYFDNDKDLVEVVAILEDRHPAVTLSSIFDDDSDLDTLSRTEYKQKCDKLFNFLWRICYAYDQVKTLSRKEVEGFRWYFRRISKLPAVVDYCENNGYKDINIVTKKLNLDRDD